MLRLLDSDGQAWTGVELVKNRPTFVDGEGLAETLEEELIRDYGYLVGGKALVGLLGFSSTQAFAKAVQRSQIPVPIFNMPPRRGKWALAKDIAAHLAAQRNLSMQSAEERNPVRGK